MAVYNVEVNAQNKLGDTPLHNASWKGHADIVEMLLEKGVCVYVCECKCVCQTEKRERDWWEFFSGGHEIKFTTSETASGGF